MQHNTQQYKAAYTFNQIERVACAKNGRKMFIFSFGKFALFLFFQNCTGAAKISYRRILDSLSAIYNFYLFISNKNLYIQKILFILTHRNKIWIFLCAKEVFF